MENRPHSENQAPRVPLTVYLDPAILEELRPDVTDFQLSSLPEAKFSILKKGDRLWVNFPDGDFCDLPYYAKNVQALLKGFRTSAEPPEDSDEIFGTSARTFQNIERKLFSSVSLDSENNLRDLWDEIIKKVNAISASSHSVRGLVDKILEIPFLQNFQSSFVLLHIKGQTKAELIGTLWRDQKFQSLVEVKDFNAFFNSVKKSKIKSFSTDLFPKVNLPFNGSFLAREVVSMKYSLIAIVSRHDFLSYSQEEIELFGTCIDLLQPNFERLIDQEFSDKRIAELRVCLKDFPLPLRVKNSVSGSSFVNDLYREDLQDHDIFFNKKVLGPFHLDLYDSDELRHYAFDLFHFQRISLLGELLNTLRHELSNPLFGLKLSSQLFNVLEVSADSKEIMSEIEKNVNRCQVIIENFSSLYQVQNDVKPTPLKKMIDESIVLSKSESREVRKLLETDPDAHDVVLTVPLIFVVQILFNLIVNAAQAMKAMPGGKITIHTRLAGDKVQIDVIDNGPGIPEDKIPNLFKPFFTTKAYGTGLGLILSRNLAVKMGGNLEYFTDNNAKGAHFRLTLPRT